MTDRETELPLPLRGEPSTKSAAGTTSVPSLSKVLIVEDDHMTASALRSLLRFRGLEVIVAHSLAQGRAVLDETVDYLVLDLMLPDGDGTDLLKMIREKKLNVKVAVTTAIADTARLRAVAEMSPEGLLRKPIDLNQLLDALKIVQ